MRWLGNSDIIRQILTAWPGALAPTWSLASPAETPPGPATGVARYRSFNAFQLNVKGAMIDSDYRWVLYDPESWDDTPPAEQQDPWTWLTRFGQYAHACGYRVIAAPARDLGNVKDSRFPKEPGEDITAWYLRTGTAGVAGEHSDILSIQSQALTEDPAAYADFVKRARWQAHDNNPYARILAGVSTRYGTAAQMAAAARAVHVDGFWLNVPGPDPDIGKAVKFLRLMTGGTP